MYVIHKIPLLTVILLLLYRIRVVVVSGGGWGVMHRGHKPTSPLGPPFLSEGNCAFCIIKRYCTIAVQIFTRSARCAPSSPPGGAQKLKIND